MWRRKNITKKTFLNPSFYLKISNPRKKLRKISKLSDKGDLIRCINDLAETSKPRYHFFLLYKYQRNKHQLNKIYMELRTKHVDQLPLIILTSNSGLQFEFCMHSS